MNPVGYRPGVLKLGHVHQQGRRPVAGKDEGGVAVRAPAPRLVRDERLVGVEACEVIDVRVVVLGGATTRPRDDGGEAALPSESERGPLARVVFGALDAYGSSRRHGVRRSPIGGLAKVGRDRAYQGRSEEHTSELQSRQYLVCRLLLEKTTNYLNIETCLA